MSLGQCLIANEPEGLKDAMVQARIEGKSWAKIAEEQGYNGPGAARTAFRKKFNVATDAEAKSLNLFTAKGQKLTALLDDETVTLLKGTVPKKTPKSGKGTGDTSPANTKAAEAADEKVDIWAAYNSKDKLPPSTTAPHILGDELGDLMKKAFPDDPYKITLDGVTDKKNFQSAQGLKDENQILDWYDEAVEGYGQAVIDGITESLTSGAYYGAIQSQTNVPFAVIDRVNLRRLTQLSQKAENKIVWDIYQAKPTSVDAFKMVQDQVWNLKKLSTTDAQIMALTNVPENVIKLILKDTWSLPKHGSSKYVGYGAENVTAAPVFKQPTPYTQPSQAASADKVLGAKQSYINFEYQDADEWARSLGNDMSTSQLASIKSYTGSGYTNINGGLRGQFPLTDSINKRADDISSAMSGMPRDATLYRGVGKGAWDDIPLIDGMPEVGSTYSDAGFMSSSYGGSAGGPGSGKPYVLVIDAPKGMPSRPVHNTSSLGAGEREVIVDRNLNFTVTGTERRGSIVYVYMKYLGRKIK
jgi:hypothetical protein